MTAASTSLNWTSLPPALLGSNGESIGVNPYPDAPITSLAVSGATLSISGSEQPGEPILHSITNSSTALWILGVTVPGPAPTVYSVGSCKKMVLLQIAIQDSGAILASAAGARFWCTNIGLGDYETSLPADFTSAWSLAESDPQQIKLGSMSVGVATCMTCGG